MQLSQLSLKALKKLRRLAQLALKLICVAQCGAKQRSAAAKAG